MNLLICQGFGNTCVGPAPTSSVRHLLPPLPPPLPRLMPPVGARGGRPSPPLPRLMPAADAAAADVDRTACATCITGQGLVPAGTCHHRVAEACSRAHSISAMPKN